MAALWLWVVFPALAGEPNPGIVVAAVVSAAPAPSGATGLLDRWNAWTKQLPSWLKFSAEIRGRSDNYFGLNGTPGRDNSYYVHRLRLNTTTRLHAGCG
jgi:hypothetical protein